MRCVELGKVRRVLDETPSGDPATGGRGPDSPLATRHSPLFRRGVTLVEMLVTLAILLLMMTAIVKIFQAATGALNAAQVYQELDNQLRLLDLTIRSDLGGVTCKLTPPNNPKNNTGYLEYGENEFADVQGEDSDDYIRFTAKAPAGQPFTGRMWIRAASRLQWRHSYQPPQPITITSEYAEIIYFLRNGNLYRRVLLVAPALQSTIEPSVDNVNPNAPSIGRRLLPGRPGRQPGELAGGQRPLGSSGDNRRPVPGQLGHPQRPGRPDEPREPVRLSAVLQRLPEPGRSARPGRRRPVRRPQRRQRAGLLPDALSRRST